MTGNHVRAQRSGLSAIVFTTADARHRNRFSSIPIPISTATPDKEPLAKYARGAKNGFHAKA
jgi:hypothetical protein